MKSEVDKVHFLTRQLANMQEIITDMEVHVTVLLEENKKLKAQSVCTSCFPPTRVVPASPESSCYTGTAPEPAPDINDGPWCSYIDKAQKITEDFSFWGRGKGYSLYTERERCTRLIAEALRQERMDTEIALKDAVEIDNAGLRADFLLSQVAKEKAILKTAMDTYLQMDSRYRKVLEAVVNEPPSVYMPMVTEILL